MMVQQQMILCMHLDAASQAYVEPEPGVVVSAELVQAKQLSHTKLWQSMLVAGL